MEFSTYGLAYSLLPRHCDDRLGLAGGRDAAIEMSRLVADCVRNPPEHAIELKSSHRVIGMVIVLFGLAKNEAPLMHVIEGF